MRFYFLVFFIFLISNANLYAVNPKIEPLELDFYSSLKKLPWDEIVVPAKEGRKIKILLKTKGLKEFANLTYNIKLFRQDDYMEGTGKNFKIIELHQTGNINEFTGEIIFTDGEDTGKNGGNNTIFIPQGDDGIPEVCAAEGAGDGGWETEYFMQKLLDKGYKNRGNATVFSLTSEGTIEEHENEGIPVLNNEYIQYAGVEKIIIDANYDNSDMKPYYLTPYEWRLPGFNPVKDWLLVKNQADILYYSFHGEHESSGLITAKITMYDWKTSKKWPSQIVPKKTSYMLDNYYYRNIGIDEIGTNWNLDMEWVYLAGCSVMDYGGEITSEWANFHNKKYNHWYDSRPGLFWAKNLLNKYSNLHGLIGFCATGKSDHPTIDECFNHGDSIVKGWIENESLFHMFLAPSIIYHPEYENETFTDLDDSNPGSNKVKYWYTYLPSTYSFPGRKRITESKLVDLNENSPRAPDCLLIENKPYFSAMQAETNVFAFNYFPAYFPERNNISEKRFGTENLTPLLGWGYFKPGYHINFDAREEVFTDIYPGIATFEKDNMKNYGINIDGDNDRIITEWNIQIFDYQKKLIIDELFQAPLIKSSKPNLMWEAGYKIKPGQKLNHNSLYYFRVRGKNGKNLWSPFSRIQWFMTK